MPIGTDMGGFPQQGMVPRINPVTAVFPDYTGITVRKAILTPPKRDDFLQTNAFATIVDRPDRLKINLTSVASGVAGALRLLTRPVPGAPYTIDFAATGYVLGTTSSHAIAPGIAHYDGTKVEMLYWALVPTGGPRVQLDHWTNTTTLGVSSLATYAPVSPIMLFLRETDDGTNRSFYVSPNGKDYCLLLTRLSTTFLTATQVGMGIYCTSLGALPGLVSIYHWKVSTGILGDEF